MRWIYLSPHLDDAALSAGGLIYDQTQSGMPVEIWTFMCGDPHLKECSPLADALHKQWGFTDAADTSRGRRQEDLKAASILGAKAVHFDFLDCIYRRDSNGKWLYEEKIFIPPLQEDDALRSEIAEAISQHLLPDDVLVCQLSVGSHVDHILVRQAAELLGRQLTYDIDMPYVLYRSDEFEAKSAGMKESIHRITAAGLERWQEAVVAYKSQLPSLHESVQTPENARESIQAYWSERRGISLIQFDGVG